MAIAVDDSGRYRAEVVVSRAEVERRGKLSDILHEATTQLARRLMYDTMEKVTQTTDENLRTVVLELDVFVLTKAQLLTRLQDAYFAGRSSAYNHPEPPHV